MDGWLLPRGDVYFVTAEDRKQINPLLKKPGLQKVPEILALFEAPRGARDSLPQEFVQAIVVW
jgi:hypothetical protein